jgi:hypothetical protein
MNLQSNAPKNALSKAAKTRSAADPILLELWDTKRQINQQANFDIAQLAKQANAFDVHAVMKKLNVAATH